LNFASGPGPIGTKCYEALTKDVGFYELLTGLAPYKNRVKVLGYTPACWAFDYVLLTGNGTWTCDFINDPTPYHSVEAMMNQWAEYNCSGYGALDGIYIDQAWAFGGFGPDYDRFFSKVRPIMPSRMGSFLAVNPGFLADDIERWFWNENNTNGYDLVGVVENAYIGLTVNSSYYDRFLGPNGLAPTVENRTQMMGFVHTTAIDGNITVSAPNGKNASEILRRYGLDWWFVTDNTYGGLPTYWDDQM
ncbi:hypothetical protein HDU93_001434, partial [Gonapodya sp. JEL0774]